MSSTHLVDEAEVDAFAGTVLANFGGAFVSILAAVGDRLGLFRALAEHGAATPAELATRTGINERYGREWLSAMASAGYVTYERATGRFTLPLAHAPALADEGGPMFFGGAHQMLLGLGGVLDPLIDSFRSGSGVRQSSYGPDWWDGMERFTAGWFENLLLPVWVPSMPDVESKLTTGCRVADVGCGRGRALVRMGQAYRRSDFVGYDVFAPSLDRARDLARDAGVTDRVRFEQLDVAAGLPETYDVVFTFDVIHDAVDPLGILKAIRSSLRPDGVYVCLDINCSERVEDNVGPLGSVFYGFSVLYCMTTSLAAGGEGLGTCGFHETNVRDYCAAAGFSSVRRVPLENPFNNLYEIRR